MLPFELSHRISAIAADRQSGASELTGQVLAVLSDGLAGQVDPKELSKAVIGAQPSMAPVWNAARAALGGLPSLRDYAQRVEREARALERYAPGVLLTDATAHHLRMVTLSFSGTVLQVIRSLVGPQAAATAPGLLGQARPPTVEVATADGHPALEGRRMAEALAALGATVTHYADAAIGLALADADAVLLGADAVTPDGFLNKTGSRMLAAAAAHQGVPVYVAATRSKFVSSAIGARLHSREESPAEVWATPPPGVTARNRYFEWTPLDLVAAVISDVGVLGSALVADACPTRGDDLLMDL